METQGNNNQDNRYVLVEWPESQDYMDHVGYTENAVPHPSESGAAFILESWMQAVDRGEVERIPDEEE